MKPGDIVLVNFQGARGIKRRPAVVVSTEAYHRERPDVILAVITTRIDTANSSTDYLIKDWENSNLRKPSAFRAYFGTYEQWTLVTTIGRLTDRDWEQVQKRLRLAIALD